MDSAIGKDKDELLERYEALGEHVDFLVAKPLFEAEIPTTRSCVTGSGSPRRQMMRVSCGSSLMPG